MTGEVAWTTGAMMLALLCISAWFSGLETSLFALRHERRYERSVPRVAALQDQRSALLATLLLGNVSANLALATFGALTLRVVAPDRAWLNVLCLTPAIVLLAEVTPKKLAEAAPVAWAAWSYWPFRVFWVLVTPVRAAFAALTSAIVRAFGADPNRYSEALGTAELLEIVDSGAASGMIDDLERDIIEAVFGFDDLTVERLMTPRTDIFSLSLTLPWEELLRTAAASGHSRIPVQGSRADDIIGVLLLKDLLQHRSIPPAGPRQLRALLLPPVFVPATKSAHALLEEFLEKQFQMAFVVDEHGTLEGLITLDDLLSELLGDSHETHLHPDSGGSTDGPWSLEGGLDAEDFEEQTGISLPDGEYNTLGGFVFMQLGRLPQPGDLTVWAGWHFTVIAMDGRRIDTVRVARSAP